MLKTWHEFRNCDLVGQMKDIPVILLVFILIIRCHTLTYTWTHPAPLIWIVGRKTKWRSVSQVTVYCSNGCHLTWNMIASDPNSVSEQILGPPTYTRTIIRNHELSKRLNRLFFLMLSISGQEAPTSWF